MAASRLLSEYLPDSMESGLVFLRRRLYSSVSMVTELSGLEDFKSGGLELLGVGLGEEEEESFWLMSLEVDFFNWSFLRFFMSIIAEVTVNVLAGRGGGEGDWRRWRVTAAVLGGLRPGVGPWVCWRVANLCWTSLSTTM